jgi:rfaE bifunctional protein nucleotidyltransferase chain/domain
VLQSFGPSSPWRNPRLGSKLVFVNGTFDLFHAGHARLLTESSKLGDALLVFTNTDNVIKQLKGDTRPLICEEERIYMLASLECVDAVFAFDKLRVTDYLEELRPDIWTKASDYTMDTIERSEKEVAERIGINIVILPKLEGFSSTSLIDKIRNIK